MIIEIVNSTTVTLIDGADRSSGKIAGPIDEQTMLSTIEVQAKRPIRAANTVPLARALRTNTFSLKGTYLGTTEDAAREWAFAWPVAVHTSGTINIKGATKKIVCANAVVQSIKIDVNGLMADVVYVVQCGAISVANL
jgi:hypothetical protein